MTDRPELLVFDVNETLSDLTPMARRFEAVGVPGHLAQVWFAGLLGGSVIVEVIFAVPGMGRLLFDAVVNSDIPLAQGGVVVVVALAVGVTTLADFVHRFLSRTVGGTLA